MTKRTHKFKILSMFMALLMVVTMILPNLTTVVYAARGDDSYATKFPLTNAKYTVYTSYNAAQQALANMDAGRPAGTVGIAKTYDTNQNAIFTIRKSDGKWLSESLKFAVGTYYVLETEVPYGWAADRTIHTMKIVPNGKAFNVNDGLVISTERPIFYRFTVDKAITMSTTTVSKDKYMAMYPITGATYVAFDTREDALAIQNKILASGTQDIYPLTIDYDESKVSVDADGNKCIFTIKADGTSNMRWLQEGRNYYIIEVQRPAGYKFDINIHQVSSTGNVDMKATSTEFNATTWVRVRKEWASNSFVQAVNPDEYGLEVSWTLTTDAAGKNVIASGITDRKTGEMIIQSCSTGNGTAYPKDGKPAIEVPLGTYYFHETGIGENTGMVYTKQIKDVSVDKDTDIDKCSIAILKNAPYDPTFYWTLTKAMSIDDEQFYNLSLKGTQFTVYYFLDDELTEDQLFENIVVNEETGETRKVLKDSMKSQAARRWVLEAKDDESAESVTLADGSTGIKKYTTISFDNAYKVAGDNFFTNDSGNPAILIGTYVFEETYSTTGFGAVDSWMWNCINNGTNSTQDFSDYVTYPEAMTVIANRRQTITIELQKSSNNSSKKNYYGTLQGAEFELLFLNPLTGEYEPATATDLPTNMNADASRIVTDSNGRATSLPLKPGFYAIREVKAPEGHTLNYVAGGNTNNGLVEFEVTDTLLSRLNGADGQHNFKFVYDATTKSALEQHTTVTFFNKLGFTANSNTELLVGATVQLWELDDDGVQVRQLPLDGGLNYVTTGEPIELYGLTAGRTYRFVEVAQPEGYLMPLGSDAYVDFTVADDDARHDISMINEKIPRIVSHARVTSTGRKELTVGNDITITDHFKVTDLMPNKSYTLKNITLRSADDDIIATVEDYQFQTDSVNAEYDIIFNVNSNIFDNGVYTVTGELHRDDRPIMSKVQTHYDLSDWDESIVVVDIPGTFAFDASKAEDDAYTQFLMNDKAGIVRDRIDYRDAIAGASYEVVTKLVDEDGKAVNEKTTTLNIPAADTRTVSGSTYVDIEVDATKYNGHTLTVFEYIYVNGDNGRELVAVHEDLHDINQQVQIPEVKTKASEVVVTDDADESNYWFEMTDIVSYSHIPANTKVTGTMTVMDPETKQPLVDADGNTFTGSIDFTTDLSGEGTYNITVKIPYDLIKGKTYAVFEDIKTTDGGIELAHHYEWDDEEQTVYFPDIKTNAWYITDVDGVEAKSKNILRNQPTINIKDEVTVTNVEIGKEYELSGIIELVLADGTISTIAVSNDKVVTATDTTLKTSVEFSDVVISLLNEHKGSKLVITEYLYQNYELVGKHYEMTDVDQTLRSPDYHTNASDKSDADKYIYNNGQQVLVDVFEYIDVMPGVEQTVITYLTDEFGTPLLKADGSRYEVVTKFTPKTTSGKITIEVPFDGKVLEGTKVTVFEDVYEGDVLIGVHHDLSQATQTVYVPYIRTHGSYITLINDDDKPVVELTDVIEHRNLPIEPLLGKVTLVDKATGEFIKDADGNVVSAEYIFTPYDADGSYDAKVSFDLELVREKTFVIYEELYRIKLSDDGSTYEIITELAEHKDLNDKEQTIVMPTVKTTALDEITGRHDGYTNAKNITLVDTVQIYNAKPEHLYRLTARLVDVKASTKDNPVFINIAPVTIDVITPADVPEIYEVKVPIDVPSEFVRGKAVVVFETLLDGDIEIAFHADIADENQTVTYRDPDVHTTATDEQTKEHTGYINDRVLTVVDEVKLKGLLPNKQYTLNARLVNKTASTDENIVYVNCFVDGNVFTTPADLKVDDEYTVVVKLAFLASVVDQHTELVVFETLYDGEVELAVHADLEDANQTVSYEYPSIATSAKLVTDKDALKDGMAIISDTVSHKGLKPGTTYTLIATAMDKQTGKVIMDSAGVPYQFEHKFTATGADGEVEVPMAFKQSDVNGKTIVVFEKLFIEYMTVDQREIASHEDIEDAAQTVQLPLEVRVVVMKKAADTGYALKGAEITIFNDKDEVVLDKYGNKAVGLTDAAGQIVFELFVDNARSYYAKETKAPAGYKLNETKFELTRDKNGVLSASIDIEILDEIIIVPPSPPQTGDDSMIGLWIGLMCASMFGIGLVLWLNKRKRQTQ